MEQKNMLYRLQIRMASGAPEFLEKIQKKDGITYAHVLARLGKKMSNEEALAMFNKYRFDDRIGLLISSFGQMGLWNTIHFILKSILKENQLNTLE